jgi:hypothetical protein
MRFQARGRARNMPKPKKCAATGRLRWPDPKAGVEVFHAAQNSRTRAVNDGTVSRRRELRHCWCPDCSGYHTTSWATADRLAP